MALRNAAHALRSCGNSLMAAPNAGALQPLRLFPQLRSFNASAAARGGAGVPVGTAGPETAEVPEHDELRWDDGSKHPEPCIDDAAPQLTSGQAARWLAMGFGMYAVTAFAAKVNDKASKVPFTPRVYPFDNLRVELGGEPQ